MKLIPHEVILVESIPNCDFCTMGGSTVPIPGPYDFATIMGSWANGCEDHWREFRAAPTLGTGKGQLWVTAEQVTNGALADPRV